MHASDSKTPTRLHSPPRSELSFEGDACIQFFQFFHFLLVLFLGGVFLEKSKHTFTYRKNMWARLDNEVKARAHQRDKDK